jgi:predicted alpha/beta hydrolase family esterase/GNAT superfamily N-acetyltransferase
MTWSVRQATGDDVSACVAILHAAATTDAGPLGTVDWLHPRLAGVVAADADAGELYVAMAEDGVIAATFAVCREADAYYAGIVWADPAAPARYLHRLATPPRRQGSGIGSYCVARGEDLAHEAGARYLRLDTLQAHPRVVAFYLGRGYVECGVANAPSGDTAQPFVPLVCFEKPLEAPGGVPVLTVPGLHGSGPRHWQTAWERMRPACRRVEQRDWQAPRRAEWVVTLDEAIATRRGRIALAAHSLGCITIAYWAQQADAASLGRVAGALLVAPADVERPGFTSLARGFAPVPHTALPFPTIVVASTDDPFVAIGRAEGFASAWGSRFVNVGRRGHLGSDSTVGAWPEGEALLDDLIAGPSPTTGLPSVAPSVVLPRD